jgi:hypothetical protein
VVGCLIKECGDDGISVLYAALIEGMAFGVQILGMLPPGDGWLSFDGNEVMKVFETVMQ